MKRYVTGICLTGLILFTLMGCQSDKKSETGNSAPRAENQTDVKSLPSGEVMYTAPEGWVKEQPLTSMRQDQFSLPGAGGADDAELAVFFFPGSGGTVDANLKRWYGQFKHADGSQVEASDVELKKTNVDNLPVTVVYLTGTYLKSQSPMMMGGPVDELPGYALLAAIAETSNGAWFFKATGPQQTIDHWRPSFDQFVKSFHAG